MGHLAMLLLQDGVQGTLWVILKLRVGWGLARQLWFYTCHQGGVVFVCVCVCLWCTWVSLRSNPLHHDDIIPNSSPVIPTPRTKTSLEQSFTGVGVARSGGERTKRNPRCWKKCLRKENRLNRDASSPVETQDPPLWEGGEMRVYSIKNCQKWIFNVKHLTGLDIRNALIKHIGSKDLVIAQSEIEIFERAALNPGLELTVLELLELRLPGHHCLTQVIPNVSVTHQAATVVSVFRSLCSKPWTFTTRTDSWPIP